MSATDLAKDAIRIVSTAGLNKDVIDLLEKKLALMTEEGLFFKESLTKAIADNEVLKLKIVNLEQQLQSLSPKQDGLKDETKSVLKSFFDAGRPITPDYLARQLGMQQSIMDYHIDLLYERKFIRAVGGSILVDGVLHRGQIEISRLGRAYCIENKS